jgi:Plant transposon protein
LQNTKRRLEKNVERALRVLKARFAIISNHVRLWHKDAIGEIMRACVIMHNMIVEDEQDSYAGNYDYTDDTVNFTVSMPDIHRSRLTAYEEYVRNHSRLRSRSMNHQLQVDLVEEIWSRFGEDENDE